MSPLQEHGESNLHEEDANGKPRAVKRILSTISCSFIEKEYEETDRKKGGGQLLSSVCPFVHLFICKADPQFRDHTWYTEALLHFNGLIGPLKHV
ncbi:unnamed protein product [Ceratitis capitata]|uniref:(Mediterranean fruit fly) hypothetical protein n=1 Tax=Ceratitis capitata TaxID=7213 RepID=A0A811UW82_CERCA|nr:unnamed protein product [Ceratitis capitata]